MNKDRNGNKLLTIFCAMIAEMDLALNSLINTFFIGRGLGDDGLAAFEIVVPCIFVVCACIALFYNGVQTVCSKDYGASDREKFEWHKNAGYTWTIGIMMVLAILFLLFRTSILDVLGANEAGDVISELCSDCYLMFIPCFILQGFFSIASSLLFLEEKRVLIIANVILYASLISGSTLVLIFAPTMTGFIAVNFISEAAADEFLAIYWIINRKRSLSAFTLVRFRFKDIKDAALTGFSDFMEYFFAAALSLLLNLYLLSRFSSSMLAGFGVFEAVENIPELICVGFCFLSTAAFGVKAGRVIKAYKPEERKAAKESLKKEIKSVTKTGVTTALIFSVLMIILARPVVVMFFSETSDSETVKNAVLILISYLIGFVFYILNSELVCYYKVVKALWSAHLIFFVEALVFPLLSRVLLGEVFGIIGFCLGGLLAEILTLAVNIGLIWKNCGHFPKRFDDFLMEKYLDDIK